MGFVLTKEIEFEERRCYWCGRWWVFDKATRGETLICPFCAAEKVSKAEHELKKALRGIAALKGRLKRRRK